MSKEENAIILKQFKALANIAVLAEYGFDERIRQGIQEISLNAMAANPQLLERYRTLRETKTTAQALDMMAAGGGD